MNLKPLHDNVVIRVNEETQSAGGIVIPTGAAEKPSQGTILAVGPGARQDNGEIAPMSVKTGDVVVFKQYAGTTIKVDGEEVLVVRDSDIVALVQ